MNKKTNYDHIQINNEGVPYIKDTQTKVIEIISEHIAYGWSPEEIYFQHNYLTLGQIYSALAFFYDNYDKMNSDLLKQKSIVSDIKERYSTSFLQNELKSKKTA